MDENMIGRFSDKHVCIMQGSVIVEGVCGDLTIQKYPWTDLDLKDWVLVSIRDRGFVVPMLSHMAEREERRRRGVSMSLSDLLPAPYKLMVGDYESVKADLQASTEECNRNECVSFKCKFKKIAREK